MNKFIHRNKWLIVLIALYASSTFAKNCKKGQPCGNSCISWNKTCRIGTSSHSYFRPSTTNSFKELKTTGKYFVTSSKVNAVLFPGSDKMTKQLKKGDDVFVYHTFNSWAQLTQKEPNQWIELKYLSKNKN